MTRGPNAAGYKKQNKKKKNFYIFSVFAVMILVQIRLVSHSKHVFYNT